MPEDPGDRRERDFDLITFFLATVLAGIIIGAMSYGVVNSSRVATPLPPPATTGSQ